jgi:hypothetical protein
MKMVTVKFYRVHTDRKLELLGQISIVEDGYTQNALDAPVRTLTRDTLIKYVAPTLWTGVNGKPRPVADWKRAFVTDLRVVFEDECVCCGDRLDGGVHCNNVRCENGAPTSPVLKQLMGELPYKENEPASQWWDRLVAKWRENNELEEFEFYKPVFKE